MIGAGVVSNATLLEERMGGPHKTAAEGRQRYATYRDAVKAHIETSASFREQIAQDSETQGDHENADGLRSLDPEAVELAAEQIALAALDDQNHAAARWVLEALQ
ncbi:MAG: hypothetical protein AAF715_28715 [Myxococcota bacterium]